jgi:putative endonuclease
MAQHVRTTAQQAGDRAEDLVAARLAASGWTIVARNLRLGRSELDVLGVDPGPPAELVVIEVRWRRRRDFGLAEETLDVRKRAALRRAIGMLLEHPVLADGTRLPALPLRLDLVAVDRAPDGQVTIRHHRAIRP